MKRRTLLAGAAASAAAVAGCVERGIPGGEPVDGGTDNETDDETTDGETTDGEVSVADAQFEARDASCGTETNEASVARETAESRVVVEGTISAPDPCHTATLGEVTYDAAADEVRVPVSTEERPDADVCTQCIAEIEYRAVVAFRGGLPATVVVSHDDEVVAEASATAST